MLDHPMSKKRNWETTSKPATPPPLLSRGLKAQNHKILVSCDNSCSQTYDTHGHGHTLMAKNTNTTKEFSRIMKGWATEKQPVPATDP